MSAPKKIVHKISKRDVQKCWKFALEYFLDESKSITDRTNYQKRGLGGVIDSFLNKIIEIAVCKKLHDLETKKVFKTDFEIHPLDKGKTEPDVIQIDEKGREDHKPNLYVEIKNLSEKDDWLGPKEAELKSIKKSKFARKNTKNIYYVYCEIKDDKGQSRRSSLLGALLKRLIKKDGTLQKFHDINDLYVEVRYVFTVADIEKYGTKLPKGTAIPDTNVFKIPTDRTKKSISKKIDHQEFKKVKISGKKLPRVTASRLSKRKWLPYPEALGDFRFSGEIEMFLSKRKTVRNYWLKCLTDVSIDNKVLGEPCEKFKKGEIVLFQVKQKGRITEKKTVDISVARSNKRITNYFLPKRLKEIAKKI